MSVRRRAAAAVIAATALVAGVLGSAVPAQAATGFRYFQMTGDAGDWVSQGRTYSYTPANATISASFSDSTAQVTATETSGYPSWNALLAAPSGQSLTEGATYPSLRFADATHGGLDVFGDGRGCNQVTGTFTVLELAKDGQGNVTAFAATFEQHCEGGTPALRGSLAYDATKSPATITSTTPASAAVNGPVTVSGTLTDTSGPIAGAAVTVSRPDGSGGTTTLDATTAADGTFSVQDAVGSSDVTYTISYAGDAAHYAASVQVTVAVVKSASTLTLSAPSSVTRGTSYTLTGTLKSAGVAVAGATVSLTRKDLAGTRLLSAKTGSGGTFSLKDTPAVGGTVWWTVAWPGSDGQAGVTATRSVTVPRASTSLSVSTDKSSYSYGGRAVVRAKLGTTYNNRVVAIYAKRLDTGVTTLIAKGRVGSTGYLSVSYTMKAKATFTAKFLGDYRYAPATRSATRNVKARITVKVAGAYGSSGGYKLVRVFDPAYFVATVAPARNGQCVRYESQQLFGSTWRTTSTFTCAPLDYTSQTSVYLPGNGVSGKVRVRATVGSNSFSSGATSAWAYVWFR